GFHGAAPSRPARGPRAVTGLVPSPSGGGYWQASSTGELLAFGDAPDFGAGVSNLNHPIVGMAVLRPPGQANGTGTPAGPPGPARGRAPPPPPTPPARSRPCSSPLTSTASTWPASSTTSAAGPSGGWPPSTSTPAPSTRRSTRPSPTPTSPPWPGPAGGCT